MWHHNKLIVAGVVMNVKWESYKKKNLKKENPSTFRNFETYEYQISSNSNNKYLSGTKKYPKKKLYGIFLCLSEYLNFGVKENNKI